MYVWLDDERPMPKDMDVHVKDAKIAIQLLQTGLVTGISLDHDLGTEYTGYTVAAWIEEHAIKGDLPPIAFLAVHSMNPVGKEKMKIALIKAKEAWEAWEVVPKGSKENKTC